MSQSIRIRMYNVGFGDAFLIELPGKKTVLVDAGFHSQGKGAFAGDQLVDQIVHDLRQITGGEARIDVVIATHRHQDHVYAFNSDKWDEVEVGEVWVPWVEDRKNLQAIKLWKKKKRFAANLAAAADSFGLAPADREGLDFMLWNAGEDLPGFAAVGGWSNAKALDRLHEGFARRDRLRPRYLPQNGDLPDSFQTDVLPGVRVHVLGPARDPDFIEELDPEDDGETYRALALRAAMAGGAAGATIPPPFGDEWHVAPAEPGFQLDGSEIERMNDLATSADALLAAHKLDDMINSTSLVLVLQIGKARLLLPGDAEWGTWKRILDDPDARALLRGASFLKVGHHGSHNATSKTLVEQVLPQGIPAMVSTQEGKGTYRNNIPLTEMLDALVRRDITYVRSDRAVGKLPKGFKRDPGKKWIDLTLPC